VFATKARTQIAVLVRVIDGHRRFGKYFGGQPEGTPNFGDEENLRGIIKNFLPWSLLSLSRMQESIYK
jgi:hypothetical protein